MLNQRHLLIRVQEECCPKPLLLWWCAVLTPGHYLIGTAGGVLSKVTTVVLVSCSHTRTFFDWGCMCCVVQGHYCCVGVLFSHQDTFVIGTAGGVLPKNIIVGVMCCSHIKTSFDGGCWWCVVQDTTVVVMY